MQPFRIGLLALVPALCALAGLGTERIVSSCVLAVVLGCALVLLPRPRRSPAR